MSNTLVQAFNQAMTSIADEVIEYREASTDADVFNDALSDCHFNEEWDREVGGFPMTDAFEFARANPNSFDEIAAEYSIEYDRDIATLISRVYEVVLYQKYSAEFAESQRNAEFAFYAICGSMRSLLIDAFDASPDEFVALREMARANEFNSVLAYVVCSFEEAVGYPIFGAVLDESGIEGDELERKFLKLEIKADAYQVDQVSKQGQVVITRSL